jgi:hypothetical protein
LHHRHHLHADGLQPFHVGGEAVAARGCGVAQLLQALATGRLACAQRAFDLALPGRLARRRTAGRHGLQTERSLDLSHEDFLPRIVPPVAHYLARQRDATDEQVDVFVLGIRVPRDDERVVRQPHSPQIVLGDLLPLRIGQLLAHGGRQRDMQHGLAQIGPQSAHRAELGSQLARSAPGHVGRQDPALFFAQVIRQRPAEAPALDGFGNHG